MPFKRNSTKKYTKNARDNNVESWSNETLQILNEKLKKIVFQVYDFYYSLNIYLKIFFGISLLLFVILIISIIYLLCKKSSKIGGKQKNKKELLNLQKFQVIGYTPQDISFPYHTEINYSIPISHIKFSKMIKFPRIHLSFAFSLFSGIFTVLVKNCDDIKVTDNEITEVFISLNFQNYNFKSQPSENISQPSFNETFQLKFDSYYKSLNERLTLCVRNFYLYHFFNREVYSNAKDLLYETSLYINNRNLARSKEEYIRPLLPEFPKNPSGGLFDFSGELTGYVCIGLCFLRTEELLFICLSEFLYFPEISPFYMILRLEKNKELLCSRESIIHWDIKNPIMDWNFIFQMQNSNIEDHCLIIQINSAQRTKISELEFNLKKSQDKLIKRHWIDTATQEYETVFVWHKFIFGAKISSESEEE